MATLEEMYRSNRAGLITEAMRALNEGGENPGHISLVAFLVKKQELIGLLCARDTLLAGRIRIAKLAFRLDANLDQAIADRILSGAGAPGPAGDPQKDQQTHDLLEVLSQTRVRPEVVDGLAPLLRDPNPRVHSKMALLMARVAPEGEWVQEGLASPDPRVRANVVEALWQQKGPFANSIFHRSASDLHHRVAANAIYGLYLQGDPSALSKIRCLLDTGGLERRAGLWILERTRDARYLSLLGKLIGKVEPEARTRCLKLIQAVKARKEQSGQRGLVKLDWFPASPGLARLNATLGERRLTNLHPFELILQASGQVIERFELRARPGGVSRQVVLLVSDCPDWKSAWREALPAPVGPARVPANGLAGDQFGFLHYVDEPEKPGSPAASPPTPPASPQNITWCGTALASVRRTFDKVEPGANNLGAAMRRAASQLQSPYAEIHLVVLDQTGKFLECDAVEDLPQERFLLDVISGRFHAGLATRCAARGGRFEVVSSGEEAARHFASLHRSWQADYDVSFPVDQAVDTVEILSDSGYGAFTTERSGKNGEVEGTVMVGAQGLEPRASSV